MPRGRNNQISNTSSLWFNKHAMIDMFRTGREPRMINETEEINPVEIIRNSFQEYIVQRQLENRSIGLEILYLTENQLDRIILVRRSYNEGVNEVRRLNFNEPFEYGYDNMRSGSVLENNQINQVLDFLEDKYIIEISVCELYNDSSTSNSINIYTVIIRLLYRNITDSVLEELQRQLRVYRQNQQRLRDEINARERAEREELYARYPINPVRNPNQLQLVDPPEPVPPIKRASYPGQCMICLDEVEGQGCRVNCPAGHVFHCDCINQWRNTRQTNPYLEHGWQNGCPICRADITQMYHVEITPEIQSETAFGKKRITVREITKMIKYLNKLK